MVSTLQAVALLPLLLSTAAAATVNCVTELGSRSVKTIPTSTTTFTRRVKPTITQLVQPTVTTSIGYYQTFTRFTHVIETITDSTVTDTFSTTTTLYAVETDTITSTITTTTTQTSTTSSTSTTIVPTTAGFKDIRGSINQNTYQRRAVAHPHAENAIAQKQGVLAMPYPTRVVCTQTVANPTTMTVKSTMPPKTKTVNFLAYTTEVDTIATTSTIVPPDVSTTLLFSTTSAVTTFVTTFPTSTQTAVTTTTSIINGPTFYDACSDANNYIGPSWTHGGAPYYFVNAINNGPGVASDFSIVANGATSAQDCCHSCFQFGTCENFLFRSLEQSCFLVYHPGQTCSTQASHPNYLLSRAGTDTTGGTAYVAGNGNCGFAFSGNSDGSVFSVD